MQNAILISIFFFSFSSFSTEFSFQGKIFELRPLGEKFVVFPKEIFIDIVDDSNLRVNNCQEIIREVSTYEETAEYCQKRPNASRCRSASDFLSFISKEENYQVPEIFYPVKRSWRIRPNLNDFDLTRLLDFVSRKFAIDKNQFIVASEEHKFKMISNFSIDYKEGSISQTVDQFGFQQEIDLENFVIKNNRLVVNNRFLACDLKNKTLEMRGQFAYKFSYTKSHSTEDLQKLWIIYTDLITKLTTKEYDNAVGFVKAALIGRDTWDAMRKNNLDPKKFPLKTLIEKFFDLTRQTPTLKNFSNIPELKNAEFPDKTYEQIVQLPWSL